MKQTYDFLHYSFKRSKLPFLAVKVSEAHKGISNELETYILIINTTTKLLLVMKLRDVDNELQNVAKIGF